MDSVVGLRSLVQPSKVKLLLVACVWCALPSLSASALAKDPPPLAVPGAVAATAAEMKPYTDLINNTEVKFEMLPIPGGKFVMGSSDSEAGRKPDEGPEHEVEISPFWMGKCEVTWD